MRPITTLQGTHYLPKCPIWQDSVSSYRNLLFLLADHGGGYEKRKARPFPARPSKMRFFVEDLLCHFRCNDIETNDPRQRKKKYNGQRL